MGRLLRTLAGALAGAVDAVAAESGTGTGVGAAWILAGLGSRGRLVTVEHDPERVQVAAGIFAEEPRVTVLEGDWTRLRERGPYALLCCGGGGGKRAGREQAIELLVTLEQRL